MLTKEDIQLLSCLMDEKLKPINDRLDKMEVRLDKMESRLDKMEVRLDSIEEQLDEIKENTVVSRDVLNEVVNWIDCNFREEYPFPVNKIAY